MANEIRYEQKYKNLKMKFMDAVDLAFRLGFEQGQQQAQMDQMAQQQQQAELAAAQAAQQGPGGQPGEPGQEDSGQPQIPGQEMAQENPMGSELDQHLDELEGLVSKSELTGDDLKKAMSVLSDIKSKRQLRKSHEAIKSISLALHTPAYKVSKQAQHNLTDTAKNSLHVQQRIVDDIFKHWDEEERETSKSISTTLQIEGLLKK